MRLPAQCKRGHDTSSPEARYRNGKGNCKQCVSERVWKPSRPKLCPCGGQSYKVYKAVRIYVCRRCGVGMKPGPRNRYSLYIEPEKIPRVLAEEAEAAQKRKKRRVK